MESELPETWERTRLADCGTWVSGGTPDKSRPEYWNGDLPWLGPKDLHVRYADDAEERVTTAGLANGTRLAPTESLLVVVRSMALAKRLQIALTRRPVAFNQDIKAIIPAGGVQPRYLLYAMWGCHDALHRLVDEASHGTKRLRTDVLGEFAVPLPPLDEQRRIVRVLGALDDKIDSNRRLAALLEQAAAELFRARFVDFVGVEEFEDSEIGRIPRGWGCGVLSDLAAIRRGITPRYTEDGGVLVVNQRCIRDRSIGFAHARRHDDRARVVSADRILRLRDIVVNSTGVGTLGRVATVRWLPESATVDSHVTVVRPSPDAIEPEYLAHELMSRQRELEAFGEGTTGQTELSRARLAALDVRVPERSEQLAFATFAKPLVLQTASLERELLNLIAIRDALLPKLISGAIRVPDTSDPVEAMESAREHVAATER